MPHINFNLYHYERDNPVRYLDPDGRADENYFTTCDAVIAFGKLSVDTNPVVSASVWIASMIIDYFADASKRKIESFIQYTCSKE